MNNTKALAVAILAAGKGKRMGNPERAKVLTMLLDRPLIEYVLQTAHELNPSRTIVIVGHQRQAVTEVVKSISPNAVCVVQEEQLGTGHAVQQIQPILGSDPYDVLILNGDVPLITASTLTMFINSHRSSGASLSILTTIAEDPSGYGRIVRDGKGAISRVVEHKDASADELQIREINSGIYIVDSSDLFNALKDVRNSNSQQEYYLTDIVSIIIAQGKLVEAFTGPYSDELLGINTVDDLESMSLILKNSISDQHTRREY